MSDQQKIAVLRSKIVVYRNGLNRAKEKGEVSEICEWLESIRNAQKEIEDLL
jgi:hypothetical protein